MATYTTPATFAASQALPFDDLNEVAQNTVAIKQGDVALDKVTNAGAQVDTGLQNIVLAAGNNNNITINAGTRWVRLTPDAGGTSAITGFTGGTAGRDIEFINITTDSYSVTNNSGSSTAANRIICHLNANKARGAAEGFTLKYDGTSSLWRMKG
jgi:hypothetical protein